MNILPFTFNYYLINYTYVLCFSMTFLLLSCSVEHNSIEQNVSETLMSKTWLRDRYATKSFNGVFESYMNTAEFQFLSQGQLLIKEAKSKDTTEIVTVPPPIGISDTLTLNGTWAYNNATNTLTLRVDDLLNQYGGYTYIDWTLSYFDPNRFELENPETSDTLDLIKVSFKYK